MTALSILVVGVVSVLAKATSTLLVSDESEHGVCSTCHLSTVGAVSFLQSSFGSSTHWNLQQQVAAPHELAIVHPPTSANESTPDNISFRHASNSSSADFVDLVVLVPNASSDVAENSSLQTVSVKQESSNISSSAFVDVVVAEPPANASFVGQSVSDLTSQAYDENKEEVNATGLVTDNSTENEHDSSDESSIGHIWNQVVGVFWKPDASHTTIPEGGGERLREKKRQAVKDENYDLAKKLKADIEALHDGRKPVGGKPDEKHEKTHSSDKILGGVLFTMFFLKMMAWV